MIQLEGTRLVYRSEVPAGAGLSFPFSLDAIRPCPRSRPERTAVTWSCLTILEKINEVMRRSDSSASKQRVQSTEYKAKATEAMIASLFVSNL